MSSIAYNFPGGGATSLRTDVPAGPAPGVDPNLYAVMAQLARRRAESEAPRGPRRREVTPGPMAQAREHASSPLEIAEREARMAQLHAISGGAPLRKATVGGSTFDTLDTDHMTGAQRQVFLPDGSGFAGPSLAEQDAHADDGLDRFAASMARRRLAGENAYR